MEKLTTIVLTREKSEKLNGCLDSLKNLKTDLIILIDTDKSETESEKIAKKFSAKIIKHVNKEDFSAHRNFALKNIKTEYVFYIDDDERVSDELAEFLNSIVVPTEVGIHSAYAIPRKNIIFGKEFKHSGQWPDYVIRIFKRDKLKGYKGKVHEQPEFDGELKHLDESLIHLKHDELSEMVEKTNKWSEIEAKLMFDAGHPPMNIFRFSTAMFREFWHRMVMQTAFLDGPEGIIYALYQVFSRFISYAKLWEMQLKSK